MSQEFRLTRWGVASAALALLPFAACDGSGGGGGDDLKDEDGDGLANEYEDDIGTSDQEEDSDGDGWSDYDEVYGFADPDDETDHPYTGGWARGLAPSDLGADGTGNEEGTVAEDFALADQFEDTVSLWSFYGQVILIENAAVW